MKTTKLLIAALTLIAATTAQLSAENISAQRKPTIYLFSMDQSESEMTPRSQSDQAMMNRAAVDAASENFRAHYRTGFGQVDQPTMIFTERSNKFSFAVGGFIKLRMGYDVDGTVNNLDFIPYDISVPGNYNTRSKMMLDPSASRLFAKALINTRTLGTVEIFVDGDYRGGTDSDLQPRVRTGYVAFLGWTFGRDVTTFCDLDAAPQTIDFEGPNAYNFNFANLIRYQCSFLEDRFTVAAAAEYPQVWGTYGEYFAPLQVRVPDVPVYLQYAWGAKRGSHIRVAGVFRNPYMYDLETDSNTSLFAWGSQLSGRVNVNWFDIVFNGVYGEGISQYIQDLTGSGLDFTPNPENAMELQTTPMWGWQAAAEIKCLNRVCISGGYSTVHIDSKNGYYSEDQYKQGDYIFGNIFYNITPRLEIAAEYLYGKRINVNEDDNYANRVNVMMQYSF